MRLEAAIEERRQSCRSLRRAQRDSGSRSVIGKAWEDYKSKKHVVKKIIRRKKEEDRARTLRFIQENGVSSSGQI